MDHSEDVSVIMSKRDTHVNVQSALTKTDAHVTQKKHRNHREHTSERSSTKDQSSMASVRIGSPLDHKDPARKIGTHALVSTHGHRGHDRELRSRRNDAARIIQQTWRR